MVFVGFTLAPGFASCVGAAQNRAAQSNSAGGYVMLFAGLKLAP